jgi:hypothetical protein
MMRGIRNFTIVVAVASGLSACGGVDGDSDLVRMGSLLLQQTGLLGGSDDSVSREKAASVPMRRSAFDWVPARKRCWFSRRHPATIFAGRQGLRS